MLPPTEKSAIPLARLRPLAYAANFEPSGWYAAVPSPERATKSRTTPYVDDAAASAIPIPPRATPLGISQYAPRRSDQSPKKGCTIELDSVATSITTAASV